MSVFVRRLGFALVIGAFAVLLGAAASPGAGQKWTGNYPSLTTTAKKFPWLVVKCKLNDVLAVQAGLDDDIDQFFGASGSGYGNLVDYFHDVSYNAASVFAQDVIGWVTAPFGTSDLAFSPVAPVDWPRRPHATSASLNVSDQYQRSRHPTSRNIMVSSSSTIRQMMPAPVLWDPHTSF